MFGQKDDKEDKQDQADNGAADSMQAVSNSADQLLSSNGPPAIASAATDAPSTDTAWQHPGAPIGDNADDSIRDVISPAGGYPSSPNNRIANDDASNDAALVSNNDVSDAELVEIKQKALSELVPLIDKLDQPPEEKFRTIMMMIQASDDQRLVEKAYESAHAIEDEEARAQALLDIVNEINYFTHPSATDQPES